MLHRAQSTPHWNKELISKRKITVCLIEQCAVSSGRPGEARAKRRRQHKRAGNTNESALLSSSTSMATAGRWR